MKLRPDEDIYRFQPKWIGGDSFSWPFQARYLAWGVFAAVFGGIVGVQVLAGTFHGVPLLQFVIALFVTTYLMRIVDRDVPLRSLWVPLWRELRAPWRLGADPYRRAICTHHVRRTAVES